jgi:hypothetical protein
MAKGLGSMLEPEPHHCRNRANMVRKVNGAPWALVALIVVSLTRWRPLSNLIPDKIAFLLHVLIPGSGSGIRIPNPDS